MAKCERRGIGAEDSYSMAGAGIPDSPNPVRAFINRFHGADPPVDLIIIT